MWAIMFTSVATHAVSHAFYLRPEKYKRLMKCVVDELIHIMFLSVLGLILRNLRKNVIWYYVIAITLLTVVQTLKL